MKSIEMGLKEWAEDKIARDLKHTKSEIEVMVSKNKAETLTAVSKAEHSLGEKLKSTDEKLDSIKNELSKEIVDTVEAEKRQRNERINETT